MPSGNTAAGEEVSKLIRESGCRMKDIAAVLNTQPKIISRWKLRRVLPPSYAPAAIKWALLMLGKTIKVKP